MICACSIRRISTSHGGRVFIMMNVLSLISAAADLWMELVVSATPLSPAAVALGTALSYTYKVCRNATLVIYLIFIFVITRTEYRIRSPWVRLLLWLPNAVMLLTLAQNPFTHNVFTVTAEAGYARGPALNILYVLALLYGVAGTAYCIYCKRYLALRKWAGLLSIYVLTFAAVLLQFFRSDLLVEMFCAAIGLLMILLLVLRPEETVDTGVGVQNWEAYQNDLRNVLLSRQKVQLVAVSMTNAQEIRAYLGETQYNAYVFEVADELRRLYRRKRGHAEIYFERPGSFYFILDAQDYDMETLVPLFLAKTRERVRRYADMGVRFDPRVCLIQCPDDLSEVKDVINLGHKFTALAPADQTVCRAADICKSRTFGIENNMEEILNRAVTENRLEIYYQPIYDTGGHCFRSAEALARLNDSKYGMISPSTFIPAAETLGLMLPLGNMVLESVFRFIAEHDIKALGLSCIDINLSVAQCMQSDLPQIVRALQEKYGVSPSQVNFEITETVFGRISSVMDANLRELSDMGYSFSLDDYGIGYSNIQRLSRLPLSIIKIDKSMVDQMFSHDGGVILRDTVRMMQDIHKKLVIEGVETREAMEALTDMSCEFIQGFYYSKPLPENVFIDFLKSHNASAANG